MEELVNGYLKKSKYLKKITLEEIKHKKTKLYELLKEVKITDVKEVKKVLKLYKGILVFHNSPDLPHPANLLDVTLKEEKWILTQKSIDFCLKKCNEDGGWNFKIIIEYENGRIIKKILDYETEFSTLEAVAKYYGDTL